MVAVVGEDRQRRPECSCFVVGTPTVVCLASLQHGDGCRGIGSCGNTRRDQGTVYYWE